jgi:hypothetical protein
MLSNARSNKQQELSRCNKISDTVKNILIERFSNYPQLTELVNSIMTSDKNHQLFWNEIEKIDQVRKTNYKNLCPEWSQLL